MTMKAINEVVSPKTSLVIIAQNNPVILLMQQKLSDASINTNGRQIKPTD